MNPDEQKARLIIDDYIHTVTGLTRGERATTHLAHVMTGLSREVDLALDQLRGLFPALVPEDAADDA